MAGIFAKRIWQPYVVLVHRRKIIVNIRTSESNSYHSFRPE